MVLLMNNTLLYSLKLSGLRMGAIDNIEEYFNTATIHGLGYFSKTKGFVRLGWIFVVITGFMAAGVLIQESFKSWSMSPFPSRGTGEVMSAQVYTAATSS